MTQESIGSAGEDGRQAVAVQGEASVAHCVNAPVKAMQTASVDFSVNGASRIAKRPGQLTNRDHPMLALCEFRNPA
jgi:hypothetical protein